MLDFIGRRFFGGNDGANGDIDRLEQIDRREAEAEAYSLRREGEINKIRCKWSDGVRQEILNDIDLEKITKEEAFESARTFGEWLRMYKDAPKGSELEKYVLVRMTDLTVAEPTFLGLAGVFAIADRGSKLERFVHGAMVVLACNPPKHFDEVDFGELLFVLDTGDPDWIDAEVLKEVARSMIARSAKTFGD